MVLIGLGANLFHWGASPAKTISQAAAALEAEGVAIMRRSSLWSSPAWPPGRGKPPYVNACLLGAWAGSSEELLALMQDFERRFGRRRRSFDRWGARTLDLDLIAHGSRRLASPSLTLPHPRLAQRAFVLKPLIEIAPTWRPAPGPSLRALLAAAPGGSGTELAGPWRGERAGQG